MPKQRRAAARGVVAVVAYRPKRGQAAALRRLTRRHLGVLRGQDLVGAGPSLAMTAADGTVLEAFRWKSAAAMAAAHSNPVVQRLWAEYARVCDYVPLAEVKESGDLFALFTPLPLR
jgi:hypothetical protein